MSEICNNQTEIYNTKYQTTCKHADVNHDATSHLSSQQSKKMCISVFLDIPVRKLMKESHLDFCAGADGTLMAESVAADA